ncbi:Protein N-acetyltransferase, RimJ/RimL family [Actinobaculum suis]|uniref:GCN5-related N-acetyltransferase n=1 Tax=Actinobaculum suis TaxID=1657 RepID=A0A0K9EVT1_9ACTO|nr:GNAT family N-acetyltransferase [Actinobaculum suis]KMY24075.1 hypothetical protein ACU19_00840 [Actinobaculum suis]MDY5153985.1 GNAT family N-acetyltransferase [Actinobaculum suis]OCA95688.1 hypothetical protein ACU20_00540 [Actinobaculum suis]OCA95890.1 hypothetical protein ACU21_00540 [Actinobaculum suis]SDE03623.1 Protein N-acetyltransferase, RimJ/RimL family [Actinobaculum suis]
MDDAFKVANDIFELQTRHLDLTGWRRGDAEKWAAINEDSKAREFISGSFDSNHALDEISMFQGDLINHGFGLWAVRVRYGLRDHGEVVLRPGDLIGFAGVTAAPLPEGETLLYAGKPIQWQLSWCLDREVWGMGLATEAALKVRDYMFGVIRLPVIAACAPAVHGASLRVMEKIGLKDAGTYEEKMMPEEMRETVVRAMSYEEWLAHIQHALA